MTLKQKASLSTEFLPELLPLDALFTYSHANACQQSVRPSRANIRGCLLLKMVSHPVLDMVVSRLSCKRQLEASRSSWLAPLVLYQNQSNHAEDFLQRICANYNVYCVFILAKLDQDSA